MINSDLVNVNLFSGFIHLEIIFKYIMNRSFNAAWISEQSVKALKHNKVTKTNWSHKEDVFNIGFKKWVDFIYSLPDSYLIVEKNKCISSFGKLSNLGTFRGFIMMRARGHFTYSNYKKYKFEINLMRTIPNILVIIILIIPSNLLAFFLKFYTTNHL